MFFDGDGPGGQTGLAMFLAVVVYGGLLYCGACNVWNRYFSVKEKEFRRKRDELVRELRDRVR